MTSMKCNIEVTQTTGSDDMFCSYYDIGSSNERIPSSNWFNTNHSMTHCIRANTRQRADGDE
jgi:hypothetical protein